MAAKGILSIVSKLLYKRVILFYIVYSSDKMSHLLTSYANFLKQKPYLGNSVSSAVSRKKGLAHSKMNHVILTINT